MISAYNLRMGFASRSSFRFCARSFLCSCVLATVGLAQTPAKAAQASGSDGERAANLAESGHCTEALPLLRKAIHQPANRELKKRVGLDGLHCAMTHDTPYESLEFLAVLSRDFPHDPDVLYA